MPIFPMEMFFVCFLNEKPHWQQFSVSGCIPRRAMYLQRNLTSPILDSSSPKNSMPSKNPFMSVQACSEFPAQCVFIKISEAKADANDLNRLSLNEAW